MKRPLFGFVAAALLTTQGAAAPAATLQTYEKARSVLLETVAAYGGIEKLRSIRNVVVRMQGDVVHRNQSRKVDGADREPYFSEFIEDLEHRRYARRIQTKYPGAILLDRRLVFDGKELIVEDLIRRNRSTQPPQAAWPPRLVWLPHFPLLTAMDRAQSLRYLGTADFRGRPHDVLAYTNDDGQQNSLYIDSATKLVSKLEWLTSDVIGGDCVSDVVYDEQAMVDGFVVVGKRLQSVCGETTFDVRHIATQFNKNLTEADFELSPDFTPSAPAPKSAPVTKLSDRVYVLSILDHNVLCVEFDDHVVVVEAPGGDAGSREALKRIRETIPDKPVRYVAVTHHHFDHAGGVRTYVAEGATLVTTRGNADYFRGLVARPFTIAPDTLARSPQPLKIELVEGEKRVFTDGKKTLELYNIGPSPHADELLVAYLPGEGILFEADVLDRPSNGEYPIAFESTIHFGDWIERKRLAVKTIIPVHGAATSIAELRQSVITAEEHYRAGRFDAAIAASHGAQQAKYLGMKAFALGGGFGPPIQAAERAAAAAPTAEERAGALLWEGFARYARAMTSGTNDYSDAADRIDRALAIRKSRGIPREVSEALLYRGLLAEQQGEVEGALKLYEEALRIARAGGDAVEESYAQRHIAFIERDRGNLASARRRLERSLKLRERSGLQVLLPFSLLALADLDVAAGRLVAAERRFDRARSLASSMGLRRVEVSIDLAHAELRFRQHRREDAADMLRRALQTSREIGYIRGAQLAEARLAAGG